MIVDELVMLRLELDMLQLRIRYLRIRALIQQNLMMQRRRRDRRWWCREWLGPVRRQKFGLFDQLMVELRAEDTASFKNFLRMPPEMFDELVRRLTPRLRKKHTNFRAPIEPAMKLAITLRHLASGNTYHDMRFHWRVIPASLKCFYGEIVVR